jgi:4-azaleucine resistance transporter AzlC
VYHASLSLSGILSAVQWKAPDEVLRKRAEGDRPGAALRPCNPRMVYRLGPYQTSADIIEFAVWPPGPHTLKERRLVHVSLSAEVPLEAGASRRAEFLAGVRGELPLLLGVVPFGMIYGTLALSAGLPPSMAQAMSSVVFAGSAQFVIAQLVGGGAPMLVIILTAFIVNVRHSLYSASVAPYLKRLSWPWKGVLAYLLTDEAYAVAITRYIGPATGPYPHWFFLGAGLTLWSSWQVSTAVGIFLGALLPAGGPLEFALPLTFIALVVPALKDRASVVAAVTAGVAVILGGGLPLKLGLVAAALAGIFSGVVVEWAQKRFSGSR